jgi:hypothetical protein
MVRTATAVTVAILLLTPVVGFAQQEELGADRNASPGARSSPETLAVREGLAAALDGAVTFQKSIPTPPTGTWGIISEGTGGGGIFRDSDSEAEAWLGSDAHGVRGFGSVMGGYFKDSDGTGYARVGTGDYGIRGYGTHTGGYFEDSDGTGYARLGFGNYGIYAYGSTAAGYFTGLDNNGNAYLGHGSIGISAFGLDKGIDAQGASMGGYFGDLDGTGYANVGSGDRGIEAYGTSMGGYFKDSDGTGYAHVGSGNRGIEAWGSDAGGYFRDSSATAHAYAGYGNRGIEAWGADRGVHATGTSLGLWASSGGTGIEARGGNRGGYFRDANDSGYAYIGTGDTGIFASGTDMGGSFSHADSITWAHIAEGEYGIKTGAGEIGGYFLSFDSSSHAYVGWSTYKIAGSGAVSFVQNHPYDASSVIVYTAPEGDEVATYTRGTAELIQGEATVSLGETFKWVTNPDIGLTAYLTPVGAWCDLYVVERATDQITVRSRDGSDCTFDYMVYGLRIGFEESRVVQEKIDEAYIPSMASHRELYDRRPDLRKYNSLERFKTMHLVGGEKKALDLSRAHALRDAIVEFDPTVHELPRPPGFEEMRFDDLTREEARRETFQEHEGFGAARVDGNSRRAADRFDLAAGIPVDAEHSIYAPTFQPPSREVAPLVDVSEAVEPGDVLVIDRETAGQMRRGFEGNDSGVVGIVLGSDSSVLTDEGASVQEPLRAEVAMAGVVNCKVDAAYGAIWPGDLLVTSPTPGHAMRTGSPLPGTIVGKALEPLAEGNGLIRVLVMLR